MATYKHPAHPGGPGACSGERWQRMWSHREQLLKVARRRSVSVEDAEDAVHEAMLRAVENPHVDDERLGAWLTTVTMRLCIDRHRQVNREVEVRSRSTLAAPGPVPVEEVVCDRAEAKWLADRSGELPARQAQALRLKSEDRDVGQVAHEMGLSYEAVESLLARARRTLRNSLAGTLALVLWVCDRGRPRAGGGGGGGGGTQAVAMVSTAASLAVLGLSVPYAHDPQPSRPPQSSTSYRTPGPALPGHQGPPPVWDDTKAQSRADGTLPPSPGRGSGGPQDLLPALTLPTMPGLPAIPGLPSGAVASVPQVPDVPSVPSVPPMSDVPPVPSVPDVPDVPSTPKVPSVPSLSHPPHVSLTPAVPSVPTKTTGAVKTAAAPWTTTTAPGAGALTPVPTDAPVPQR
ncbi:RNA polymerase sigma factor [Wenjunlia tyrosinilytica]|uniref:RNA polymerase sigma factor n=1 Tax=Wenjunlia tyrosinilytica TaxID=1544741 RepID=A0A917ZZ63_9ACTN|nr:sigma-70 family RNA polymerase sigma factor [Wenjunlia tyrosinilytica]GGO98443.1 hypothetical protein GCM10012280_62600 [Wenjunlia tyrosinilytica]